MFTRIQSLRDIRRAHELWKSLTQRQRMLSRPQSRRRAKPGEKGEGKYYRIVVRPKTQFTTFRYHDVGRKGHIQRLAARRSSGSWDTQAWLISKDDAHVEGNRLVPDTIGARKLLNTLGSKPRKLKGDVFEAKDRRNIPEREKPTRAQQRAYSRNIRRAQAVRRL